MRGALIAAAMGLVLCGCTVSESDSQEALAAYGFHEVVLGEVSFLGCGRDDNFSRTFVATGPSGVRVKGVICQGLLKGATVRITGPA